MPKEFIGLVFGALGILANAVIFQQKTGKKLLICKLISDVLWAIYYLLLGGYSAAMIAGIGILRESIFLNQGKKWADSPLWFLLFAAFAVLSGLLTATSLWALLPMTASLLSVYSFRKAKPRLARLLAYPISGCMLLYDIIVLGALGTVGMINEGMTLISTTVALAKTLPRRPSNEDLP